MKNSKEEVFKIGELAKLAKVNIQTIRYYERQKILSPAFRKANGYRVYDEDSLKKLYFIKEAQSLGFSLQEIKVLLTLRVDSRNNRKKVREKTSVKIEEVKEKVKKLKKIEKSLKRLVKKCEENIETEDCPILESFEVKHVKR